MNKEQGIVFRKLTKRAVSSMATGQRIFSNSLKEHNPGLADAILKEKNWRANYQKYMDDIYLTNFVSPSAALDIAKVGLGQLNGAFEFVRGEQSLSLGVAMKYLREKPLHNHLVIGERYAETKHFEAPANWQKTLTKIETWTQMGLMESCLKEQVKELTDNPSWLNLQNEYFVILGATAEISPIEHLLELGATVIAVARKKPENWRKLIEKARRSSGRLIIPVSTPLSNDASLDEIVSVAGTDLIIDTPEIAQWLAELNHPLHLGCYAYLDSADHVRVSVAMDSIAQRLKEQKLIASLSYSLTPTDIYMVPDEVCQASIQKRSKMSVQNAAKRIASLASFGSLCKANIRHRVSIGDQLQAGVVNSIVRQQGPNYILAKRIQRWRAVVARSEGLWVSCNVVPAVRTQSVLKNNLFRMGYEGAENFGLRMFDPDEVNVLIAISLVQNVFSEKSYANPEIALPHPEYLFVQGANHGGIWRNGEKFESILPLGVLAGYSKQFARKCAGTLRPKSLSMS